jgi:hypothetical protein
LDILAGAQSANVDRDPLRLQSQERVDHYLDIPEPGNKKVQEVRVRRQPSYRGQCEQRSSAGDEEDCMHDLSLEAPGAGKPIWSRKV